MSKGTYKITNWLATAKYRHVLLKQFHTDKNGYLRKKVFWKVFNSSRRWKLLEGPSSNQFRCDTYRNIIWLNALANLGFFIPWRA